MTFFAKAVYAVAAVMVLLVAEIGFAYWWTGRVPTRPPSVDESAVFLWAPYVGLPGPRRGWWLSCSEDNGRNRCKLSDVKGSTEYEGEFVPYSGKTTVPADELKIDVEKTRENKIWIENAWVPLVFLANGKILIPASKYEQGKQLLTPSKPSL
jgi:hypothetical protein